MAEQATHATAEYAADGRRVLILLCTYNEVDNLPHVVERLSTALPYADILVVDDNSPDGTGSWASRRAAENSQMHVLLRAGKLGLGSALRDGIRWCLDHDYDYLINLDADLSHDPTAAPKLLNSCRKETGGRRCDVAIASRYILGGGFAGLPWYRRLLSRTLNAYATRLLQLPITDCSGSFRCYRVAALRRLELAELTCNGYGFLEEILVRLHRQGSEFCEVPIIFEARSSGHSKLALSDAIGTFRVIHRLALRR